MKLRWNILIIAGFVFTLALGILIILCVSIRQGNGNDFVTGALIGLLGTGLTALTSLGNNILEKDNVPVSESSLPKDALSANQNAESPHSE